MYQILISILNLDFLKVIFKDCEVVRLFGNVFGIIWNGIDKLDKVYLRFNGRILWENGYCILEWYYF